VELGRAGVVDALLVAILVRLAAALVNALLRHLVRGSKRSSVRLVRKCRPRQRTPARNILEVHLRPGGTSEPSAGRTRSLVLAVSNSFFLLLLRRQSINLHSSKLSALIMFRATSCLLDCRITFFTRSPCGLCNAAKDVVQKVKAQRPFAYQEVNVMAPGQERWKSLYEFDTPVVSFTV
jgi:hypothetical protein